jgi:hypothetical protein
MMSPESVLPGTAEGDKKLVGSTFVVRASTIEEVREIIETDQYWVTNVVRTAQSLHSLFHADLYMCICSGIVSVCRSCHSYKSSPRLLQHPKVLRSSDLQRSAGHVGACN